ncbi:nuclear receptor subfamily 2 group E member 1-like [Cylas formicarius]|uniref:nuclear receptor subfamily 2 group E member 1-like n=1 Tax=Cylas formicarius TaxID=197179 RepID=UPI002958B3C4|nr:nuclear receptor subfamily 2 group E member 1-like [Cylas formicarius]
MDEAGNKTESLCRVCGDKASGKHYGVASCDGCRGFFKRSIRRNLEYVCKENGRCIVDVTRRNQCQACRFKKCLQVNMKRDAVQHERAPRTSHASIHHYQMSLGSRFRTLQTSPVFPGLPLHYAPTSSLLDHSATLSGSYLSHGLLYPGVLGGFARPVHHGLSIPPCIPSPYVIKYQQNIKETISSGGDILKDDEVSSSEEVNQNRSVAGGNSSAEGLFNSRLKLPILTDMEPKPQSAVDIETAPLSVFAEPVYESAAKLLFLAIKWARTIPSFLQLSYKDQTILLEESWNDLFVLTAAQWALPVDENVLLSNVPPSRQSALEQDARKLREVISRLTMLRVDHTEHAYLKALVLFKAESRGLCEPAHVELLQDQTHVMLHEYCTQRQNNHKSRFGRLLLMLPGVQSVSKRGLEELLFKQTVGDVSIDKLLGDLAKSSYL